MARPIRPHTDRIRYGPHPNHHILLWRARAVLERRCRFHCRGRDRRPRGSHRARDPSDRMTLPEEILLALHNGVPMEKLVDQIVAHAHTRLIECDPQSNSAWRLLRAALDFRQRREWEAFEAARAQDKSPCGR